MQDRKEIEEPSLSMATLTVSQLQVQKAKEDLQVLNVEKEIADEIVNLVTKRLNEVEKKQKITEDARVQLLGKYQTDVTLLDKKITQKIKVVKLYELEKTQNDLIESFKLYKGLKLDFFSKVLRTFSASSSPPSPPLA